MRIVVLLTLVLSFGMVRSSYGQSGPAPRTLFERYSDPIGIFHNGLGTFSRPMSSTVKEAQAYFDQGFQMMYSFAKPEAVRSFREAWKRDPDCAICYWGEAWAWGSYLNAPMSADEAPHAYAAARKLCRAGSGSRRPADGVPLQPLLQLGAGLRRL